MSDCCIYDLLLNSGEAKDVVVRRQTSSAYEQGRWIEQTPFELKVKAVIQPAKSHELVRLPEGNRTKGAIKIYTTEKLQVGSVKAKTNSDKIIWHNDLYEVAFLDDWLDSGYYKFIAIEVGQ